MALAYYRIHRASESLDTLLDSSRKDGWCADDESAETQPVGISCCADLDALRSYVREYSMSVRPGDLLVRVVGSLSYDSDRDHGAERVMVEGYEVLADAHAWLARSVNVEG
jgi:hypothetical protein